MKEMYDLSSKFNTFYKTCVVLPQSEQHKLHEKKNLNIERLKAGLKEYNEENKTSYSIKDDCVQGSVAMSTVVQNEASDYDIDVAIVFDKSELDDKGALATRNMVANALKRKTSQFKTEPIVKTSCVRVKYEEGYHIDFAVFRHVYDKTNDCWSYEHAGSEWSARELNGLSEWFKKQNDDSNEKLRKIIRLSKMFCQSRDSWKNMPSGLLQTVLIDEQFQRTYKRIDELFYYTMKAIVRRLEKDTTVVAPVDNGRALTTKSSDTTKMTNWKNRLKSKLEDLEVLFSEDCSEEDAMQAWYSFFNHDYWNKQISKSDDYVSVLENKRVYPFDDTEQYIEESYPVQLLYSCRVSCQISGNGWRPRSIGEFLSKQFRYLPHNLTISCTMEASNCPAPYKVYWKVKNVGPEAQRKNQVRGQIVEKGKSIIEHSNFYGNHYIECYIVKDGICVAKERVDVPIGRK